MNQFSESPVNEIILSNQCQNSRSFQDQSGVSIDQLSTRSCINPTIVFPHTPYLLGGDPSAQCRSVLSQMPSGPSARELTNLSLS